MAKGDLIEVEIGYAGGRYSTCVLASKAGRTVRRKHRVTKQGTWLDVDEMTRTGRTTGNSLSVRVDSVLSIKEVRLDRR
jgi:hypothetical protein